MSIFRSDPPLTRSSDEAVARYLEALRPSLEPDPLFKRRLRGVVVNQFVAAREGHVGHPGTPRRSSQMGRIGRASLVASLALAASVGSVMAASQGAIPGDLLYPLKRQVESLRVRILPPDLQDELAAYVLTERVSELGRLADAGEWALAVTLTEPIAAAIAELESLGGAADVDGVLTAQLQALNGIVSRMPAAARGDVEVALSRAEPPPQAPVGSNGGGAGGNDNGAPGNNPGGGTTGGGSTTGGSSTNSGGANNDGSNPTGSTNNGGANNDGSNPTGSTSNGGASNGGANSGGANSGGTENDPADKKVSDGRGGAKGEGGGGSDNAEATPKPSPGSTDQRNGKPSPSPTPGS